MKAEETVVKYVCGTTLEDFSSADLQVVKHQLLAVIGTTIAGAKAEGCETIAAMARDLGGKPEATIFIHGGKVPAQQAAFANGVMARALDFCDALAPGAHIGSALISAVFAAAEIAGGLTGKAFLATLAMGTELTVKLNLGEPQYDGFDPTGVCVPFGATAAAARILGLSETETWNALALAFNKCGGSFQANVDGALAVRVIEGWAAETGVTCARLAKHGITGPTNFLEGVYGYFHLFGRDLPSTAQKLSGLGSTFDISRLVFKKYPSCGLTQGSTDTILSIMEEENLNEEDIRQVNVIVPPYTFKLVGHPFRLGSNPKVNAQFSIQYCVASAIVRKAAKLIHFEADEIKNPAVLKALEKVTIRPEPIMKLRGHTAFDMQVITTNGKEIMQQIDFVSGFPEKPLTSEEHRQRFRSCIEFSRVPMTEEKIQSIFKTVDTLEALDDIRELIPLCFTI